MATPVLIPVSEYLSTMYHPDRDHVDGELLERNLGETPHSTAQALIASIFIANRKAWGVRAFVEQRMQITATRYRIPDVCVVAFGEPLGPIVRRTPLICIEVLSPEDLRARIQPRLDDYLALGVEHLWIIDPVRRLGWTADATGWHPPEGEVFAVPETPIRIELAEIYSELDDLAAGN